MRALVATLVALSVAACGSTSATTEPTASPSRSGALTPATASGMRACRLPVWVYDWSASGDRGTGYFLQVPGGNLLPAKPPVTSPDGEMTYLATVNRWLPIPRRLVAPDKKRYAYNDSSGNPEVYRVHVVDIGTGVDHVIAQGSSSNGFEAVTFDGDGLYAGRPSQGPGTQPGLFRIDPQTGMASLLESAHHWFWISQGFAYTVEPSPTDPVLEQGGPVADTLLRLDLRSGVVATWLRKRGTFVNVRGFDWSGRPVVVLGDSAAELDVLAPRMSRSRCPAEAPRSPSLTSRPHWLPTAMASGLAPTKVFCAIRRLEASV